MANAYLDDDSGDNHRGAAAAERCASSDSVVVVEDCASGGQLVDLLLSKHIPVLASLSRLSPLSEGSMAQVHRAYHAQFKLDVAVKVFHHSVLSAEAAQEFIRARQLDHPNLVKYLEFGTFNCQLAIVMEFAPRGDLLEYILTTNPRPLDVNVLIFKQILAGVEYLHLRGKVHGDLKPENIILMHDGRVKLCDLGSCVEFGNTEEACLGTLPFMAPEAFRGKKLRKAVANPAQDLWALGIVWFALVQPSCHIPWGMAVMRDSCYAKFYKAVQSTRGSSERVARLVSWGDLRAGERDVAVALLHPVPARRWDVTRVLGHLETPAIAAPVGADFNFQAGAADGQQPHHRRCRRKVHVQFCAIC